MDEVIEILKKSIDYIGGNGREEKEICDAEKLLGIGFAPDYRCYLKVIGLACFGGHELTGICKSARLNVVDVTLICRELLPNACAWYVVEELNVDGIVIWQAPSGEIYQTAPNTKNRKICSSLTEYIKNSYGEVLL